MILEQYVTIIASGAAISYYRDLGYDAKYHEELKVKVEDLPLKSNVEITALCDYCKTNTKKMRYADYNKNINYTHKYACKDCTSKKVKETSLAKYGVESYFITDEFKEKRICTYIKKYGAINAFNSPIIKEKIQATLQDRYGVIYPMQSEVIRKKIVETNLLRYGCENASQNQTIKDKVKKTNLERFGVECSMQNAEVRAKANKTLCQNGTQKTSQQQIYLHNLFGGEINYPISYYAVDICFVDEKIVVEYDGGGHKLRVTLGRLTEEEFRQKEIKRQCVIKRTGYKQITIISSQDYLPSDEILIQMFEEAKEYLKTTTHTWVEYDIDKSIMRNAVNKDGIYYDFGILRKLKHVA